jgi:hypothetical protein
VPPAPGHPNPAAAIPPPASSRPIPGAGSAGATWPDLVTRRRHRGTKRHRLSEYNAHRVSYDGKSGGEQPSSIQHPNHPFGDYSQGLRWPTKNGAERCSPTPRGGLGRSGRSWTKPCSFLRARRGPHPLGGSKAPSYLETVLVHWPAGGQRMSIGLVEQAESASITPPMTIVRAIIRLNPGSPIDHHADAASGKAHWSAC